MTKCKVIVLANQKGGTAKTTTTLALERIMESILGFSKLLFQWLSQQQKAVQQDRVFMSMTRMELLQRRMQNLRGR